MKLSEPPTGSADPPRPPATKNVGSESTSIAPKFTKFGKRMNAGSSSSAAFGCFDSQPPSASPGPHRNRVPVELPPQSHPTAGLPRRQLPHLLPPHPGPHGRLRGGVRGGAALCRGGAPAADAAGARARPLAGGGHVAGRGPAAAALPAPPGPGERRGQRDLHGRPHGPRAGESAALGRGASQAMRVLHRPPTWPGGT